MPPERRRYRSTDLAENQQGSIRWQSLVWDFGLSRMICKQMLNVNSLISFVLYIWEIVTQLVSILNSSMHMLTTPSVNSPTYSTTMKDGGRDHHKWYKKQMGGTIYKNNLSIRILHVPLSFAHNLIFVMVWVSHSNFPEFLLSSSGRSLRCSSQDHHLRLSSI